MQAAYVRAENGYKLSFANSSVVKLKSLSYRNLDDNYTFPVRPLDTLAIQRNMESYNMLKQRLVKSTLICGALGFIISSSVYGFDVSIPYIVGVLSGSFYIYLLGKKTDSIAEGFGSRLDNSAKLSKVEELFIKGRLLVPLAMVLAVGSLKSNSFDSTVTFNLLTKREYLGSVAGFLTYFIALIFTEVRQELRPDDFLSFLPGSFAEAFRQSKKYNSSNTEEVKVIAFIYLVIIKI